MELKDYIVLKDYEHDYILQNYQYIYKFVKNKIFRLSLLPRPKPQILVENSINCGIINILLDFFSKFSLCPQKNRKSFFFRALIRRGFLIVIITDI